MYDRAATCNMSFFELGQLCLFWALYDLAPSDAYSVFEKGAIMTQILLEKPDVPFCVYRHFDLGQFIDSFAYTVQRKDDDVQLELALWNEDEYVMDAKGPEYHQVEAQGKVNQSGMHTLCVKTAYISNRANVPVMLGIFILTPPSNESDALDDAFGVLHIENLTHVATRVMMAISNGEHIVRQSALYMVQDTQFLEHITIKITVLSSLTSSIIIIAAAVQVHCLKRLFASRVKSGA